ncbi:MAG: hypothetical protein JST49_10570 [Bacteroidetes bacterium]|nr:hypothetical protein [Bacteroidota bacterium]
MENNEDILKELREIAPKLAGIEKKNLFTVPEGYFSNLNNVLMHKVQLSAAAQELPQVAPLLAQLKGLQQAEAPAGYFSSFSTGLLGKIRASEVADELQALAPVLRGIEKVNAYEAPAGYFNTLAQQVLAQATAEQKPATASDMPKWLQSANFVLEGIIGAVFKPKYSFAFAGSLSMMILAGMFMLKVEQCTDVECQLAQLSTAELDAYMTENADEFHASVLDISTDETKLKKRNDKGTLSIDKYLEAELTDEDLESAIY